MFDSPGNARDPRDLFRLKATECFVSKGSIQIIHTHVYPKNPSKKSPRSVKIYKNPQSVNFNREIFTRSPDALLEEERSLQDLIVSLMTVDPKKRPTATEVWAGEIAA